MDKLVSKSLQIAIKFHDGQKRKYTGEPYICHPVEVYQILCEHQITCNSTLAAALLHDVIEDTECTEDYLEEHVSTKVASIVKELTDVYDSSYPENRKVRKACYRQQFLNGSTESHNIKLADLISNHSTIVKYDTDFAKIYIHEMILFMPYLNKGKPSLMQEAFSIIRNYMEETGECY